MPVHTRQDNSASVLLLHIHDIMHSGDEIPLVAANASLSEAIVEMTKKRLGMVVITDAEMKIQGVFTDGDLRRALEHDNRSA